MVGYSANMSKKSTRAPKPPLPTSNTNDDKENIPSSVNVDPTSPPTGTVKYKRRSSLSKTASRISELAKPKRTPNQRHNKQLPKTTPPRRYSDINSVVDDPFRSVRDLPRTPMPQDTSQDKSFSPTTSMYRIDGTVDLIELGPSESHFLSPILIRTQHSPASSPIKAFSLPTSSSPPTPSQLASSSLPPLQEEKPAPEVLDESHLSLSEVSLGNVTPQKPKLQKSHKTVSQFDLRSGGHAVAVAGGAAAATPKKVVVLNGGKRRQTFSPREHPDLTLADMLHDLSFGTDNTDDVPVAEDVAEVSKEEFLWSMKSGFEFLKHGRRGQPHKRLVWFDLELGAICWMVCGNKKKIKQKRTIKLHEIVDIVCGTVTPVFARSNPDPNLCFSIVGQKRTLDLECSTEQVRDFWMSRFYLLKILQHEIQA